MSEYGYCDDCAKAKDLEIESLKQRGSEICMEWDQKCSKLESDLEAAKLERKIWCDIAGENESKLKMAKDFLDELNEFSSWESQPALGVKFNKLKEALASLRENNDNR